ncbi:MAG: hypothetical protein AAF968_27305, partial [Pseudomonadota bacterium]
RAGDPGRGGISFERLDDEAFGEATPVKPKMLSPGDPATRFTRAKKTHSIFASPTNYLVGVERYLKRRAGVVKDRARSRIEVMWWTALPLSRSGSGLERSKGPAQGAEDV